MRRGRWIRKELNLQGTGVEITRKWIFKERPTIRIRVNLQGMDLSRKSRSGIRKETNLLAMDFARNRATGRHLPCVGSHCFTCFPTQVNAPRLSPAQPSPQSIHLPRRDGMLSWPRLHHTAMERPGVELVTSRSQVQRPNHYTTEPPTDIDIAINLSWSTPQTWRTDVTQAGFGRKLKKFGAAISRPLPANFIPCKLQPLEIQFPTASISLQIPFLAISFAWSLLYFLAFSVPCKFRTLPKPTTFLPFAFPCKFISLQSEATPVSQAQLTGRAEFTRGCYNYSWH